MIDEIEGVISDLDSDLVVTDPEMIATLRRVQAGIEVMAKALREAREQVCEMLCPSQWRTADGEPPHHEKCQKITEILGSVSDREETP